MSDVSGMFDETLAALDSLRGTASVNTSKLKETIARLRSLKDEYAKCMHIHDSLQEYLATYFAMPHFDPEREALVKYVDGRLVELFRLPRADPNTPVTVVNSSHFSSFVPSAPSDGRPNSEGRKSLELQLSARVEAFYTAASRWWKLFELEIIGRSKPEFIGVQMVRNKLIEHADKTFSASKQGVINSFGTSSQVGPTVKPYRYKAQTQDHQDAGLSPNVREMLTIAKDHIAGLCEA